jgi:CarD family transcriptional regulator
MSTRKKTQKKKTSDRPSKTLKKSAKSSATKKSKIAKPAVKAKKPVKPAKKAVAKSVKTAKISSRSSATKAKSTASKSGRLAASAKSAARAPVKSKAVAASKNKGRTEALTSAAKTTASLSHTRKIVSAAKKKSESVKKGHDRLSEAVLSKTIPSKAPASEAPIHLHEAPKTVIPPVVANGADLAAVAKPVKPSITEKATPPNAEETIVQKAVKSSNHRQGFKTNEFIVYPAHGVGQIVAIEEQEVAGFRLELFVITFVKDKMTLRVPTGKVAGVGMRKLAEPEVVKRSLDILLGRARIKRTMWSRRAQEYETKINSGDLTAISEVVRDLYRSEAQPEQSYSERQLYEAALDRMAREVAVVQKLTEAEALKAIDAQLQKGQRRGAKSEIDVVAGAADSDVEEAA